MKDALPLLAILGTQHCVPTPPSLAPFRTTCPSPSRNMTSGRRWGVSPYSRAGAMLQWWC
eukprot:11454390-Prorocentrum_lima.AAC.1